MHGELSSLCLDTLAWKQARPFRFQQKWEEINGEKIEYDWVMENLIVYNHVIGILCEQNVEGVQIRIGL